MTASGSSWRPNPLVFLSSTLRGGQLAPKGFAKERQSIYSHGQQYGNNAVWVDEISQPKRGPDPFESIDDFLLELEHSKLYLAVIATDWPGTRVPVAGHDAQATFFETELFYAATLARPIVVILRTDISIPPDTANLLGLLQRALPRVSWHEAASAREAEEKAKQLIDLVATGRLRGLGRKRGDLGRILLQWWHWREPTPATPGIRWLDGRFFSLQGPPKSGVVEECLRLVDSVDSERQRLSRLWIGVRELMGEPYNRTLDLHWLRLWNDVLTAWNKAAAWYGLHGHLELGYLAALNSLLDIHTTVRRLDPALASDPAWAPPYTSLASAYYAAAHRVSSRQLRRLGLLKALRLVDQAHTSDPVSRSNMLAVRGSILHKLRAYVNAVETYRTVLHIRKVANASTGSIGEAMTELGFGMLFTLQWKQGRDLLRAGLGLMEQAQYRAGFVVRAKRKLALALYLTGRFREARQQRIEADDLAARSATGRTG